MELEYFVKNLNLISSVTFLVVVLSVSLIQATNTQSYTCSTPNEWLENAGGYQHSDHQSEKYVEGDAFMNELLANKTGAAKNYNSGTKWPGGIVKYKLSPTLTPMDRKLVYLAFEEYHAKTCIKFEPWSVGDPNFTSIDVDNRVCGLGHVCMTGGYQFALIGQNCRTKDTLVHELGHNLCLGHEHQRDDRDEYLNFRGCTTMGPVLKREYHAGAIYDYASQMHYSCHWCQGGWPKDVGVNKCGPQVTDGLSVLDADYINDLYDCQGCYRHRWKSIETLTSQDKQDMYSFGHTDLYGQPIYPCRAFIQGEVAIGKYSDKERVCYIPFGREHVILSKAEVLTIPGGLSSKKGGTSRYELANIRSFSKENLWQLAVPAGHIINYKGNYASGYIAFGTLTNIPLGNIYSTDDNTEDVIGKVWRRQDEDFPIAHFPIRGLEMTATDNFKILICR